MIFGVKHMGGHGYEAIYVHRQVSGTDQNGTKQDKSLCYIDCMNFLI